MSFVTASEVEPLLALNRATFCLVSVLHCSTALSPVTGGVMNRSVLATTIALLVILSTPLTAAAQSRDEAKPNGCEWSDHQDARVCWFYPAENGQTTLYVFPGSIRPANRDDAVNFVYMSSTRQVRNYAQVNCHESLDHWHRFSDSRNAEVIPVTSYASHRMLNYICESAGHRVWEQTRR